MDGLLIKSPAIALDNSLPSLKADPMLVHGSLVLFDASKFGGVPQVGTPIPNIAIQQLQTLFNNPALTQAELGGNVLKGTNTGDYIDEMTAKGGLHHITRAEVITGNWTRIDIPDIIKQHILTNNTNSYYGSIWFRITRATTATTYNYRFSFHSNTAPTTNNLFIFDKAIIRPVTTSGFYITGVASPSGNNLVQDYHQARAVTRFGGTPPANIASMIARIGLDQESIILYRVYVEDLTVSGRTAEEVRLADIALKGEQFGVGGKFHEDTFRDPNVVFPVPAP